MKPRQQQGSKISSLGKPRPQRAKLSNIMCMFFSTLAVVFVWMGFRITSPLRLLQQEQKRKPRGPSKLARFVRPPPHKLPSHATVQQVDAYLNSTWPLSSFLGSHQYMESDSCTRFGSCEIHFPYIDIEEHGGDHNQLDQEIQQQQMQDHVRTDCAVLTRKGFKSAVTNVHSNQDRAFVIAPLELTQESSLPIGPDDFMMGLFDGHGPTGHGTAQFAALEIPPLLLRSMQRRKRFIPARHASDSVKASIKDSILSVDENLPILETSGSTGILILRIGNYLFMASTGDSQAFLVKADVSNTDGGVSIVKATVPHKPDEPMESARIKAMGGEVIPKMSHDTSSRVIIPVEDGMTLALAMSRTLGDPEGKKANVVIADPNVDIIDLSKLEEKEEQQRQQQQGGNTNAKYRYFIFAASDGMLDKIEPEAVAQQLAQSLLHANHANKMNPNDPPPNPLVACHFLIQKAAQMWMKEEDTGVGYRDDISIAVKLIDI